MKVMYVMLQKILPATHRHLTSKESGVYCLFWIISVPFSLVSNSSCSNMMHLDFNNYWCLPYELRHSTHFYRYNSCCHCSVFETGFFLVAMDLLCTSRWTQTQRSACFFFPSAGIKGVHHHRPACDLLSFVAPSNLSNTQTTCRSPSFSTETPNMYTGVLRTLPAHTERH